MHAPLPVAALRQPLGVSLGRSWLGGNGAQYGLLLLCSYYVIVAWIWSIIWYLGLDPIKWMMMYALNEDGWRNKAAHKEAKQVPPCAACQAPCQRQALEIIRLCYLCGVEHPAAVFLSSLGLHPSRYADLRNLLQIFGWRKCNARLATRAQHHPIYCLTSMCHHGGRPAVLLLTAESEGVSGSRQGDLAVCRQQSRRSLRSPTALAASSGSATPTPSAGAPSAPRLRCAHLFCLISAIQAPGHWRAVSAWPGWLRQQNPEVTH